MSVFLSHHPTTTHRVQLAAHTQRKLLANASPCWLRCYIQWTEHWDSNGMEAVALSRLQPIMEGGSKGSLDLRKHVQQVLVVHNSRRTHGATPRHYIAFVNLCGSLYSKKRSQLLEQQDFIKVMPSYPLPLPQSTQKLKLTMSFSCIMPGSTLSSLPSLLTEGVRCLSALFVSCGHAERSSW